MKKKMIVIEVIILLCFGTFTVYFHWASQAKHVEMDEIVAEIYAGHHVDIIAEMSMTIGDARQWDLPGLSDEVLNRFERVEVKLDPTQQIKMIYASCQGVEYIIYYVEFVRRDAVLSDYVHVVDHPMEMTFHEIIDHLREKDYVNISNALQMNMFYMAHAHTTELKTISDALNTYIENAMHDVIFFHLMEEDAIIFMYRGDVYLVISHNGSYDIVLPEPMSFDDFIAIQN